jgi:hypothetical protein
MDRWSLRGRQREREREKVTEREKKREGEKDRIHTLAARDEPAGHGIKSVQPEGQ